MLFQRFESKGLSHYSYAVGCQRVRELAIVDPRRDVDGYLEFAERRDLTITHVVETHIHADYASGALELAERSGAELQVSGHDEGERYEVAFPHRDLRDGDSIEIGRVRLQAVHTPGHTPEHVSLLVYDLARSREVPAVFLTGDFLFIGSVGRPDLLGERAKRELASEMYTSLRERIADLPDGLEVRPAHGAGSLCGSGMTGRPISTLGYERATNPYLDPALDRDAFIERLLSTVPPFPSYYLRMKEINSEGPRRLDGLPGRRAIEPAEFRERAEDGEHVVIDLRDQLGYGGGHIPGSFGIGARDDLPVWASWVVPYDRPILLVAEDDGQARWAARHLVRVGLDDIRGYLRGGIDAWISAGYPIARTPQIGPEELSGQLEEGAAIDVLDVRTDEEWEAGHIEGAHHIMGGTLPDRLDEVPSNGRPLAVVCGTGYRSTVALSVLERAGFRDTLNVTGGMTAWERQVRM